MDRLIEVYVEANDEIPRDVIMRFQAIGAPRVVERIRYEPDDGPAGIWRVVARRQDGSKGQAHAAEVDDSGEGTSTLIYGGDAGLELQREDGGETIYEAYLLLAGGAVLD